MINHRYVSCNSTSSGVAWILGEAGPPSRGTKILHTNTFTPTHPLSRRLLRHYPSIAEHVCTRRCQRAVDQCVPADDEDDVIFIGPLAVTGKCLMSKLKKAQAAEPQDAKVFNRYLFDVTTKLFEWVAFIG